MHRRFRFSSYPLVMMAFGFFIMKKLVFDLVERSGTMAITLLVKNRGQEERIVLSDIKNVNYSPYVNPPRVTLSVRRPTVFGGRNRVQRTNAHRAVFDQPRD